MRRLAALLSAVLVTGFAESAAAEKRVAFVVGNSSYQNVNTLTNPANDAAAITRQLQGQLDLGQENCTFFSYHFLRDEHIPAIAAFRPGRVTVS